MSHTVTIEPDGSRFAAREDETLLQAARRAGLVLPHECGWGSCSTCKVTLVAGETELLFPAAPAISPRDARTGRILACQSMARSDLTIRLSPAAPPPLAVPDREQRAELVTVEELAPEIRRFTFRTEAEAAFLPGQYAILHLAPGLRRAYSMCNLPDGETLQFISKRYPGGAGSTALAALDPGAELVLEAPFGTCTLARRPGRKLFVAGGTGISPILALVREAGRDRVDFAAPVDVSHLTPLEHHVHLDLVLVRQKLTGLFHLEFDIVIARFRTQSNFLDLDLVGLGVLGLFPLLFVFELAVIHDPANRRTLIRSDFDQIHPCLCGDFHRL